MNAADKLHILVHINSHTENTEGVNEVGETVAGWLPFMSREIVRGETRGDLSYFTSESKGNTPRILLCGHGDTVHRPELHFPVRVEGDKMYGPGVSDMKGGLVVIVETLARLHRDNNLANMDFLLIPDEELGSTEHARVLEDIYARYDYALVYEGSGFGTAPSTRSNGPSADPAGRHPQYTPKRRTVVVERKGAGAARFTVTAPGGHSGFLVQKEDRISAIEEGAQKVQAIFECADYSKGTTTNVGRISGGTAVNAIAENCTLEADYRIETMEERKRIRKAYEDLGKRCFIEGTGTTVEWLYDMPPMQQTIGINEFAELVRAGGGTVGIDVQFERRGGGSDANRIGRFVDKVLDGFGPQGGGDHTVGEYIYLSSLESSLCLSVEVLKKIISPEHTV